MRKLALITLLATTLGLAACNGDRDEGGEPSDVENGQGLTPDPDAPVSIIRADVEQPETAPDKLETLGVTIGFPEGGSTLDQPAIAALEKLLEAEQVVKGGAIVLRGHSDAGGSDSANMRASLARGEAVRDWLIAKGIDESRIKVIAFGEQNPVEPNALPDGSPSEAGRSANRRVDIEVGVQTPDAPSIMDEPKPEAR